MKNFRVNRTKSNITQKETASKLKTTMRTIERNVNILKEKEILQRIETDKVGYWKIKK